MRRAVAGVLVALGMVSLGVLVDRVTTKPLSAQSSFVSRSVNSVACVRKKPNGVCVYQCEVTDHYVSMVSGDPLVDGPIYPQVLEDVSYCFRQRYPDGPGSTFDPFDLEGDDCDSACAPASVSMCCDGLDLSACPR